MRRFLRLQVFLLLPLLAIPLAVQESSGRTPQGNKPKPAATQGANQEQTKREEVKAVQADDPAYLIGAQDVLDISVWKEPEISRIVPVRPDGKISLPLVRDIQAAGLTPMQLERLVAEKLQKYVTDPQVSVIVKEINSQRIYILGEVNRSGTFTLLPNMTVLQALSGAGGFTQFANLKGIYVTRLANGRPVKYSFNYKEVINGQNPGQNIVLKPGDTIVVP
jgi:polysaccharide export outer membrane protein